MCIIIGLYINLSVIFQQLGQERSYCIQLTYQDGGSVQPVTVRIPETDTEHLESEKKT